MHPVPHQFIPCLNNVALLYLSRGLGSLLPEILKLHDLSHDEALLKVRVDTTRCLRGFRVFLKSEINIEILFC